jgi:hypothetical protein
MLDDLGTAGVARALGTQERSVRRKKAALGLSDHGTGQMERTFTLDNLPAGADWSPESLLNQVGLDPAGWRITNVKARGGHYGRPEDPSSQIRLEISVVPLVAPAFKLPEPKDWKPLPKPKPRKKGKWPETAVILSDQHCPHIDETCHKLICQWLGEEQPDRIHVNGDLLDFSTISRHRQRDGYAQSVNDCLQSAFNTLRDYRDACPDARITLLRGNHCERIEHALIDNLKELHRITAADDDTPALSLEKLLHLDLLHVEYIDEAWDRAKTQIGKRLTIRHGFATGQNVGSKMLSKLAGSNVQGHTHRLSLTYRTHHTMRDEEPTETRLAAEVPCLCQIDDGLGYMNGEADWQQGALMVKTWPDNDFAVSPVLYLPGRLLLPDGRRYSA